MPMSRYLLIGLIITNIGVGGYFLQRDVTAPQSASVDASRPAAGPAGALPASRTPAIAEVVTRPSLPEPLLQAVTPEDNLRSRPAPSEADTELAIKPATEHATETPKSENRSQMTAQMAAELPSQTNSPRLQGANSASALDQHSGAPENTLPDATAEVANASGMRECRVWGPVANPEDFAALEKSLIEEGGLPEVREIDVALPPDYLVVVNGIASMAEARQVAGALGALKIDNYVVNREESGPAVAVGVFSRQTLAERQQAKVSQLGYDVSVEPMQRSQTAYNLVAHVTRESDQFETSTSACLDIAHNH